MRAVQSKRGGQRGIALFVVLIALLLLSIVAVMSLNAGVLQEQMTSSMRDRALALQNAEAALAVAEKTIQLKRFGAGGEGTNCSESGLPGSPACRPLPISSGATEAGRSWQVAPDVQSNEISAGAPEYSVQYMGRRETHVELGLGNEPNYGESPGLVEAEYYRVLARGSNPDANGRARVVLQTVVVRE